MTSDLIEIAEDSTRGGFFLVSGSFISTFILALATIVIGRLLGPSLYGQYSLSIVVCQMLIVYSDFGVTFAVTKFVANLKAEKKIGDMKKIIMHGLLLKTLIAIVLFLLNFTFAEFFAVAVLNRPELSFYVRLASFSILFNVPLSIALSTYLGLDKTHFNAITTNIQTISKATITVLLLLLGFGLTGAVLGHVASYVITGVLSFFLLLFILSNYKKDYETTFNFKQTCNIILSYGLPLFMTQILSGFIPVYQNSLLAIFATDIDIGNLKAATNLLSSITIVTLSIQSAQFPAFSKLSSAKNTKIATFFKFSSKYTTLIVVPIVVLIIIFSKEIVLLLYGSSYELAALFLSLYCLPYLLVGIGYLNLTSMFNGLGKSRTTFKSILITFIIILVFFPIFTSLYGIIGMIFSYIFARIGSTCYEMYVAKKSFTIKFRHKSIAKIYLVGLVSAVLPFLIFEIFISIGLFTILIGGLMYAVIYTTLVPLIGVINTSELKTLGGIISKTRIPNSLINLFMRYQEKILAIRGQKLDL